MADISEININDIPYSIKDTQARNSIPTWNTLVNNPFISTSLDVYGFSTNENPIYSTLCLNDNITLKTNKWETLDSSTTLFEPFIYYHDAKGEKVGEFSMYHKGDDTIGIQMQTSQFLNEQQKRNYFRIAITSTGEEIYQVSNPQNFRQAIGAVSLSGDTLTGSLTTSLQLTIKDDRIDANNPPESNQWPKHVVIKDKDDEPRGYFELYQYTDGTQGIQMETRRIINNENLYNTLRLGIKEDGTRIINITSAAQTAWQDALQVLPLSGGTLTGELEIQESGIHLKKSGADISASSISNNQYSIIGMTDVNNRYMGYIQSANFTNGSSRIQLTARKYINNANVDNSLYLSIDASGTKTVSVSDSKIWRNALGASDGVWPISLGGTGNTTGNAPTATKLSDNTRFVVYLAQSYSSSGTTIQKGLYDLSANVNIPVYGTLGVDHGGTGGTDSGWKTLTDGTSKYSGTIYYRKIGKICHVSTTSVKILEKLSNAALTLDTLPDGYRPEHVVSFGFGSNSTCGSGTIQTNGNIIIRPQYMGSTTWTLAANSLIYFHATYLLA